MRKVLVSAFVSMDGVMQAPGGPEEDPTGGFGYGGWVAPLADVDPAFGEELGDLFSRPFDLLLGRRTYDIFAAYWPHVKGDAYNDIAVAFSRVTKYVCTRKGADLTWKGSVALPDAADGVAELKRQEGPTLLTQGSSEVVHALLAAGLVDEIRTLTFPELLGRGKRLFADDSQPRAFTLTHTAVSPNGIVAARYLRAGEVETATVGGATEPTPAELERRQKLRAEDGGQNTNDGGPRACSEQLP